MLRASACRVHLACVSFVSDQSPSSHLVKCLFWWNTTTVQIDKSGDKARVSNSIYFGKGNVMSPFCPVRKRLLYWEQAVTLSFLLCSFEQQGQY